MNDMADMLAAADRIADFLDTRSAMQTRGDQVMGIAGPGNHFAELSVADLRVLVEYPLAWRRLMAELEAHAAWYNANPHEWRFGVDGSVGVKVMAGTVGVTGDVGSFYAGAWVDGDWYADDGQYEPIEADNPVDAIDRMIERLRQYRAERDREHEELLADAVD